WQVSVWEQALPSLQVEPSALLGLEQVPVAVLQVPAVWHWSLAVQTTGVAPTQRPARQASVWEPGLASVPGEALAVVGEEAGAVGLARVGAGAGGGVAGAGRVTLVAGGADDRVRADADTGRADIALRAGVAVVAGRGVVGVAAADGRIAEVVGAGVAVIAVRR